MANPVAGWYPDPSGDTTKLRWWDGNQWTEHVTDVVPQQAQAQASGQAEQAQSQVQSQVQQPAQPQVQQPVQPDASQQAQSPTGFAQPAQPTMPQGASSNYYSQQANQAQQTGQASYTGRPYQQVGYGYQQPVVNSTDNTLRLIAFILCIISTVTVCWAIIPLAWMIPMTVHCWGIYKGTKENTTAFGVCTLLFVNLIGGILLLVSTKQR